MDTGHRYMPFFAAFLAVAALSLMDAVMKGAALAAGVYTATFLRALIGSAIITPFWLKNGFNWPPLRTLKLHIERGVISAFMALTFFYALTKLPIAEAIAISFVAPLIALYLARVLLHEIIQPKAMLASGLGFVGMLVIVGGQLGQERMSQDTLWGLASLGVSASLYAYHFIVIRRQSQAAGPVEIATFHTGISAVVLFVFAPFFWQTPDKEALLDISLGSALTVVASMGLAWAYARAEAPSLVPIEYSGFGWAALFGWLFFHEQVSLTTLAGTALIVAGCLIATRTSTSSKTVPT